MKQVETAHDPVAHLIVIVLPGICVLRGRTSVPGLTLVLARTKSVDSPMLDIPVLYLERKRLYIHRSRASDDEAIIIQDGGILVDIAHWIACKLVLECHSTYRRLCCA